MKKLLMLFITSIILSFSISAFAVSTPTPPSTFTGACGSPIKRGKAFCQADFESCTGGFDNQIVQGCLQKSPNKGICTVPDIHKEIDFFGDDYTFFCQTYPPAGGLSLAECVYDLYYFQANC